MSRRWKVLGGLLALLIVALALNAVAVDNETKPAGVTTAGAKILHLPGGDLQVLDTPARNPKPGAPIVLLPCYACSIGWYDRVAPMLGGDHRVIRIDLLGEGGSQKPSTGYSIESEAQLVAAAMSRLGVRGAVVVGHSLGAAVATSLAQQAGRLVGRLVVIDQAPDTSYGDEPLLARLGYVPVLGEALARILPDSVIRDTYGAAFAPGYDISAGFRNANQVVDDFHAMTYTSYSDLHGGLDDFESAQPLDARIRSAAVPLLVIFGTEDQIWDKPSPKAAAEAYRSVPGAEIAMVHGAGHSPNVERPARTAALIREFAANPGDSTGAPLPPRIGLGGKHGSGRPGPNQPARGRGGKPRSTSSPTG